MRLGALWVSATLVALAAARIAAVIWAAIWNIRGDYYASLPGAYVETVNPTLWNSPDMEGAWGYHVHTYFHGPAQYLTLYPVAYLDSYAAIARVLLPIYAVLLAATFVLLRAAAGRLAPGAQLTIPLFASTFLFFPLLQSFIQREFEVVVCLGLSAALWLLLQDRRNAAAAVLAYVAWFKYVPLLFLGYFGLRCWLKAAGVFVLTSIAILAAAHAVFGLPLFVNNNVPRHAAQVFNVWSYGFEPRQDQYVYGTGFCYGWIEIETTLANVRHALCSLSFRARWLPANVIYVLMCLAVAASYLVTHARFERVVQRPADIERWRRALEFSIVTTVYSCFFFNHYYYLIVLIIPLGVLLTRYLSTPSRSRLIAWTISYVLLSAFVIPTSVLTRLTGVDVWAAYIKGAWFLWGELLLMYLLLREYCDLATNAQRRAEEQLASGTPCASEIS
jgi:hypothetical protein